MYDAVGQFNNAWVRKISGLLFGLNREMVGTVLENETTEHEWNGRVNYMINILTESMAEVKKEMKAEISELKSVCTHVHVCCVFVLSPLGRHSKNCPPMVVAIRGRLGNGIWSTVARGWLNPAHFCYTHLLLQ